MLKRLGYYATTNFVFNFEKKYKNRTLFIFFFKYHSRAVTIYIDFIFINICFQKSLIPKYWCLDLITPLHKEGSKDDPNNYRGICISSALLKIICSLLNNRILLQTKQRNLINKNQTGFKEKHRTADNLLTLKNVVKKYVTIGKGKLYACFVDFKKAYDSVWHEGLFFKMRRNNLQGKLLDLIIDILRKLNVLLKLVGFVQIFLISQGEYGRVVHLVQYFLICT